MQRNYSYKLLGDLAAVAEARLAEDPQSRHQDTHSLYKSIIKLKEQFATPPAVAAEQFAKTVPFHKLDLLQQIISQANQGTVELPRFEV